MSMSDVIRVVGDAVADARWLLAGAAVVAAGAWLGKRLGRHAASHRNF